MTNWKWSQIEPLGLPPVDALIGVSLVCQRGSEVMFGDLQMWRADFPWHQYIRWPLGGSSSFEFLLPLRWVKLQALVNTEYFQLGWTVITVHIIISIQTTEGETMNPERQVSFRLFHKIISVLLCQRRRLRLSTVPARPPVSAGDSGSTLAFVPLPNSIFFLVILLPLLNTAALSDLSPHKLPLECQSWSYNCDAVVAMATSQSLHLRLLGKHPEPARVKRKPTSPFFKNLIDFNKVY